MATIELSGIVKRYGDDATVVRGLDLSIADGEFVVLVGPSGCGKSTTLRMIAGLESITEGELRIDGKRVNDVPPGDRDLAMVFQSYALYPHMTVRDNISFGLRVRKLPTDEIKKRVDDVAEMLGLGELLHRLPAHLSGGQRQRVAMGRAIVRHPKAFLFDEPLSNLDAKLRSDVRAEIARLRRTLGITTVYVTHDQIEAMTLADRVVVLHEGVAQQIGHPMDVYRKPANLFVASFLGSPTINLLEGAATPGSFEVPQVDAIALEGLSSDAVCIGVRPHDMHASTRAASEGRVHVGKMMVDVIERLGAESFAFGSLGGRRIAALLDEEAMDVTHGDDVFLSCPPDRVLSFDQKGERLTA